MKKRLILFSLWILAASFALAGRPDSTMSITVSMEPPEAHYFHVVLRCEGLRGETQEFKLPVWTPGYYQIMDYAKNVLGFRAADGSGRALAWEKTSKNAWRVRTGGAAVVQVSYDVYAFTPFVADSVLEEGRAFISPTGVFMHVAGKLGSPVTLTVRRPGGWSTVATGLDPVDGQPDRFSAPDFDVLYDSPLLAGNLEVLGFEVQGIPHTIAATDLGTVDRGKFVSDLRRMVEAAANLIGDIPYKRYAFLIIGPGGGGLEHLNSTALTLNPAGLDSPAGAKSWLSFVSHEYFHHYNVKRIRPIALGPFDYDRENYTNMLWVSEGISVYYEDLVLNRAGLLTRDEVLERYRSTIARYENSPGRLFQPATESSFDTWMKFFGRGGNLANTTISYYDKGCGLGLLLDLKIRHETDNKKSLDDVMRRLYREYYQLKKRGFTDREFREVCESTAGCPLDEIFEYASTTKEIDYRKYLGYAGLDIDLEPRGLPGAWLGAAVQDQNGILTVTNVEWPSPAARAGLSVQDEIIALDGTRVTARTMSEFFNSHKSGDRVRVTISRRNALRETDVVMGQKTERSFRMKPIPDPAPLQARILTDWLRE